MNAHGDLPTFTISQPRKPAKRDVAFLSDSLFRHNRAARGEEYEEIAIFLRDVNGGIIAGVSALARWNWAHIDVLWVAQEHRKKGLGTMLLELAETRLRKAGCACVDLETFSFQAPDFYRAHGFETVFELDLDGAGTKRIFLRKTLQDRSGRRPLVKK